MVWIRNRSPAKALDGMTPYEALYGKKPTLKGVREWGSPCWVTRKSSKICNHAEEAQWISFDNTSKGHRVYWPLRRTVSVEYNVNFTSAPDLPLLEGEIGEIYLDFDALDEAFDLPVKNAVKIHLEPTNIIDQGDQDLDKQQPETMNNEPDKPQSLEQPIPNPQPHEAIPATKAPA